MSIKTGVDKKCLNCDNIFYASMWRLKIGKGKFCCHKCSTDYTKKNRLYVKEKHPRWNSKKINCRHCNKEFLTYPLGNKKYCSKFCYWKNLKKDKLLLGENHPNWKGGKTINKGYVSIYLPSHPFAWHKKYIQEHRLVVEKHLGRYLTKKEVIHHINSIKNDNRPENLYLFDTNRKHLKFHNYPYPLTSNII